jgi:O-antigen ligase
VRNRKSFFTLSFLLATLLALSSNYLPVLVSASIIILIFFLFSDKLLLSIPIILFLTLTGQELISFRTVINIIAILLIATIFLRKYGADFQKYPRISKYIIYYIIFLNIVLFLSSSFSIDPLLGYVIILRMLIFLIVCYMFFSLIEGRKTLNIYFITLFLTSIFIGISIFYDILKTGFILYTLEGSLVRYGGLYENPNYIGLLLVITIPIAFSMLYKNYKSKWVIKSALIILLILMFILLFISNSRSSILGVAVAVLITLGILHKKLFYKTIIGMGVIIVLFISIKEVNDFLSIYLRLDRLGTREYFWNAGFDIIHDFPFFGIGPEMFENYFFTYMPSALSSAFFGLNATWTLGTPHPHNFFLLFTAENGILGLISAIGFFVLFFFYAVKNISECKKKHIEYYPFAVVFLAIGVGILVRSFFEVTGFLTYGFITRDLPFWLVFISVVYIYELNNSNNNLNNS